MTRTEIGRFMTDAARDDFLQAYEKAMGLWPRPRCEADVDTGFGSVHVHRYGPDGGEPVVLLHGHGANASAWYPQVAALGERHPVIAVDTIDDPGRSVQHTKVLDSAANARWLDDLFAGLNLEGIHLIGHSYGGWLALNQAVHGSERLASVTLVDPAGLGKVRLRFFVNLLAGVVAMRAPRRFRPGLARLLDNHALIAPPELMNPVMLAARTFKPSSRPPARPFTEDELRSVSVPVLILLGGRSALLNARAAKDRAESLIPEVQAEIMPRAGHGMPMEYPDEVNRRILQFIDTEARTRQPEG